MREFSPANGTRVRNEVAFAPIHVVPDTMRHSRSSVTFDSYAHVLLSKERSGQDGCDVWVTAWCGDGLAWEPD